MTAAKRQVIAAAATATISPEKLLLVSGTQHIKTKESDASCCEIMGGVLSKGKSATPAVSAGSAPAPTDGKTPLLERQGARTAENGWTEADQRIDKLQTEGSAATSAVDKHAKEHSELPPDMQFILESGLHEEPADERSSSKGQQGSIQDAVNDIKAKYNLNQPVATGELERIRKEIELKIRLMAMREAAQQRRMAAQAASTSNAAEPSQQEQLYKVDVKGKGRADQEDDE